MKWIHCMTLKIEGKQCSSFSQMPVAGMVLVSANHGGATVVH